MTPKYEFEVSAFLPSDERFLVFLILKKLFVQSASRVQIRIPEQRNGSVSRVSVVRVSRDRVMVREAGDDSPTHSWDCNLELKTLKDLPRNAHARCGFIVIVYQTHYGMCTARSLVAKEGKHPANFFFLGINIIYPAATSSSLRRGCQSLNTQRETPAKYNNRRRCPKGGRR